MSTGVVGSAAERICARSAAGGVTGSTARPMAAKAGSLNSSCSDIDHSSLLEIRSKLVEGKSHAPFDRAEGHAGLGPTRVTQNPQRDAIRKPTVAIEQLGERGRVARRHASCKAGVVAGCYDSRASTGTPRRPVS